LNPASLTASKEVLLRDGTAELGPWINDVEISAASGKLLTTGHPLTSEEEVNAIGQIYRGPCMLIIDSLSYSAADIFAAGFQDHAIGLIVGADTNTGGGGANVWQHDYLLRRVPPSGELNLATLPDGVTLSLAIRRCSRVGSSEGRAVEDTGVIADIQYDPSSAAEVLDGFTGIVRLACRIMADGRNFEVTVRQQCILHDDGAVRTEVKLTNIDFVIFYLDGVKMGSAVIEPGMGPIITPTVPVASNNPRPGGMTIEGYAQMPAGNGASELVLVATNGPQYITPAQPA
jgi:hypothetical protein